MDLPRHRQSMDYLLTAWTNRVVHVYRLSGEDGVGDGNQQGAWGRYQKGHCSTASRVANVVLGSWTKKR